MSDYTKINYYDLKLEALCKRLPLTVGLKKEVARLNRILGRELQHNAIISAPSGSGKTALIMAWAENAIAEPAFTAKKIAMLNPAGLQKIGQLPPAALPFFQEALLSIENTILIIDSF